MEQSKIIDALETYQSSGVVFNLAMGTRTKHNEIVEELDILRDEVTMLGLKGNKI